MRDTLILWNNSGETWNFQECFAGPEKFGNKPSKKCKQTQVAFWDTEDLNRLWVCQRSGYGPQEAQSGVNYFEL